MHQAFKLKFSITLQKL